MKSPYNISETDTTAMYPKTIAEKHGHQLLNKNLKKKTGGKI